VQIQEITAQWKVKEWGPQKPIFLKESMKLHWNSWKDRKKGGTFSKITQLGKLHSV